MGGLETSLLAVSVRNLNAPSEDTVGRNLWGIVAGYDPEALVAARTALEAASASDGSHRLVCEQSPKVELAGVVLGGPLMH